ncbi:unnamed protein product [Closterium sp. Naga37s-1]|nr:unnamed protein product [Closterium sp. Naga37s-1]
MVVPTFPERNRPQGQPKRNADADPPSPRHRMAKRQRNAITAKEKLHWLKMQDSQPDLSNRALAKLAKDHLMLAHMRDKGEVEVLDDVNDLVDDELIVNPFYAEVPMPAEELQAAAQEADAAEEDAEAAAAKEEGGVLEEGGEAIEPSDDEWWRPGRFDGENCEEWHAGDDSA